MDSFYGGRRGQSFKISYFFNNRKEMLEHLLDINIFSGQFALVYYREKNSEEYNQNLVIDDNINYNNFLYQKTFENLEWQWKYITDLSPNDGPKGDMGDTLYPSVSQETGEISWTIINKPTEAPEPVNIRGPQGPPGISGTGINIKPGTLNSIDELPEQAEEGDAYFIRNTNNKPYDLYIYHDNTWLILESFNAVLIDDNFISDLSTYSSAKIEELIKNIDSSGTGTDNGINIKPEILNSIDELPDIAKEGDAYFIRNVNNKPYDLYIYHENTWLILENFSNVLIDDNFISDLSTYSSAKIEELIKNDNINIMQWGEF